MELFFLIIYDLASSNINSAFVTEVGLLQALNSGNRTCILHNVICMWLNRIAQNYTVI